MGEIQMRGKCSLTFCIMTETQVPQLICFLGIQTSICLTCWENALSIRLLLFQHSCWICVTLQQRTYAAQGELVP